jgi:putative spermidine/putrescine transport system permease protein
MFLAAFWRLDPFTVEIVRDPTLDNFRTLVTQRAYLDITLRTVAIAVLVTVTDAVLAFPIALYMARVASRRVRGALVVAILMPLWASYLVKVYAWRTILGNEGLLNWALAPLGIQIPATGDLADLFRVWLVFSYLWLPYMILPVYAALERLPSSLVEASADLGARAGTTFRRVVLPIVFPSVVAGSIFTFSLTLGDYIAPTLVSNTQFIGNAIYRNLGVANNVPLAAAFATVPMAIMVVYLLIARRLGAFDAL